MTSDKNLTVRLIEEVGKKSLLWDPKHNDYKDRSKRKETWIDICSQLVDNYRELPEEMQNKIRHATKSKWMAIQEMYLIESSRFEMNFNNEKTGTSPLEKHLKFLKDIPPIMNSWNHCNLESEEIIQKGHVEDYYNEAVLSKSKNTDADILMKYLSTKVLEMDDDWVFLNKILTFLKTLDNVDKCVFRKLVYKCMQTVEKSAGKEKEKCDEGSEPISNPMKNEKSDEPVEKVN